MGKISESWKTPQRSGSEKRRDWTEMNIKKKKKKPDKKAGKGGGTGGGALENHIATGRWGLKKGEGLPSGRRARKGGKSPKDKDQKSRKTGDNFKKKRGNNYDCTKSFRGRRGKERQRNLGQREPRGERKKHQMKRKKRVVKCKAAGGAKTWGKKTTGGGWQKGRLEN